MRVPELYLRLKLAFSSDIKPLYARHLLAFLCWMVKSETGQCFALQKTIADQLKMHVSQIKKGIEVLKKTGWIEVKRRQSGAAIITVLPKNFASLSLWKTPYFDISRSTTGGPLESTTRGTSLISNKDIQSKIGTNPLPVVNSKSGGRTKSSDDDSLKFSLVRSLRKSFPRLEQKTFDWAFMVVRLRGRPPSNPFAYYRKSIEKLLRNIPVEARSFLTRTARTMILDSGNVSAPERADLREDLKRLAAGYGLPYDGDVIDRAIADAERQLGLERRLKSDLYVGINHGNGHGKGNGHERTYY